MQRIYDLLQLQKVDIKVDCEDKHP
jgi:hypothetical protein